MYPEDPLAVGSRCKKAKFCDVFTSLGVLSEMRERLPAPRRALVKCKLKKSNPLHSSADSLAARAWATLRWR